MAKSNEDLRVALARWRAETPGIPTRVHLNNAGASLMPSVVKDAITAHLLLRLRVLHPSFAVAVVFVLLLAAGVSARKRPSALNSRLAIAVVALAFTQLAAGLVILLLLAPIPMQLVHLLLADALWITLVLLTANVLATATTPGAAPSD